MVLPSGESKNISIYCCHQRPLIVWTEKAVVLFIDYSKLFQVMKSTH